MTPSRWLAGALAALTALVVAASLATPVATQGDGEWALGMVHHLPGPWNAGLALAALALCVPPIGTRVVGALGTLGARLHGAGPAGGAVFVVVVVGLLALGLSEKAYYTLRLGVQDFDRAYPTNLGSNVVLQLLRPIAQALALTEPLRSPRDADLAEVSWLLSLPWAAAAWGLAGRLGEPRRRLPLALLVLATPATALFAGHREIYSVPGLCVLLTAWAAVADLQEDRAPWRTGLAMGAAVSAHLLAVAVLPLWAWVLARRGRSGWTAGVLPAIGLWAALALWLWFGPWQGLGPPDNPFLVWGSLAHLGEGHGGLFWTGFDPQSPSGFLSEPHRIEWLNLVLFQVPQVLGLCAIGLGLHRGGARLDAPRRGLLWLATGAIAVSLLDRPFGGHLVQWAHNTGLATAGGLLAAGLWSIYDNDDTWRWGCAALLGLGLYRTVGFVVLNHLAPPF